MEKTLASSPAGKYVLRLYVAGASDRSIQALKRVRRLCETELNSDYDLEVIDIYQQPILARDGQILATPTLVRQFPLPMRKLIGNLSNASGLFAGLDLNTRSHVGPPQGIELISQDVRPQKVGPEKSLAVVPAARTDRSAPQRPRAAKRRPSSRKSA
jgi:circadian clock protein KaiB